MKENMKEKERQHRILATARDAQDLAYHLYCGMVWGRSYPKGIWRLVHRNLRCLLRPLHHAAEPGVVLGWVGYGELGRKVAKANMRMNLRCAR